MQGDRELDGAEPCREVAAHLGDRVDEVLAQLARELLQFRRRQPAQICGRADRGEQRVRRCGAHGA
jgi:hypothetical protein